MLESIWQCLGADAALLDRLSVEGSSVEGSSGVGELDPLPSHFDVSGLAIASVAAATLSVAALAAQRSGSSVPVVHLTTSDAAAAFASEMLFEPVGWQLPAAWDPIAGNYRTADGWIRLHTNYEHHRRAVFSVLGSARSRDEVAAAVGRRQASALETAVVAAGGCAARLSSTQGWHASEPGRATATEPPVTVLTTGASTPIEIAPLVFGELPLKGVRVLDLTRVIAGPECTRFLAAYGADVLRLDPPGFAEVPALLPEMLIGKRSAWLDLSTTDGRRTFASLVAQAHVVVTGLRPGALGKLGFSAAGLRMLNPALIIASLNAYGWSGPWQERRGFDSLVQMSTGLAAGIDAGAPVPLPVQALDHGAGYVLAAGVCRALQTLAETGRPSDVRTSLVAMANLLLRTEAADSAVGAPDFSTARMIEVRSDWGPARRVAIPGRIEGIVPSWRVDAGHLGRHTAAF